MPTTQLQISGMSCDACVSHVTNALRAVPGVREVQVQLSPGSATINHEGVDLNTLMEAVSEEGYEAQPAVASSETSTQSM
jgi:copper chaperone CopZ